MGNFVEDYGSAVVDSATVFVEVKTKACRRQRSGILLQDVRGSVLAVASPLSSIFYFSRLEKSAYFMEKCGDIPYY